MHVFIQTTCTCRQLMHFATGVTSTTSSDMSSDDEFHITVEVGVFGAEAVAETAQNICEELNGVAVGRMGQRILYMVNSYPRVGRLSMWDGH